MPRPDRGWTLQAGEALTVRFGCLHAVEPDAVGLFDGFLFGQVAHGIGFVGGVFRPCGFAVPVHDGGDVAADADVREAVAARVIADLFEGFGAGYGLGAWVCLPVLGG